MSLVNSAVASELTEGFRSVRRARRSTVLRTSRAVEGVADFARSVVSGLDARPRQLDCRFLYDARGSELYEQITRQPEYYLTRTEAAILAARARDVRQTTGGVNIIELGSGSSAKTDHLLRSWTAAANTPSEVCYIPVDVSETALLHARGRIGRSYPGVRVIGINSTFEEAFPLFAAAAPAMVVFLGSTIGNLDEAAATRFFREVARHMTAGDYFLLGIDLVKSPVLLEAAYNDAAGVTAAFTCNLFSRMNRELDSGLDLSAIRHVARWQPAKRRIEIYARFDRAQTLRIGPLDREFVIDAGEEILVEISRKFHTEEVAAELTDLGYSLRARYTDEQGWFALLLAQKTGRGVRKLQ